MQKITIDYTTGHMIYILMCQPDIICLRETLEKYKIEESQKWFKDQKNVKYTSINYSIKEDSKILTGELPLHLINRVLLEDKLFYEKVKK